MSAANPFHRAFFRIVFAGLTGSVPAILLAMFYGSQVIALEAGDLGVPLVFAAVWGLTGLLPALRAFVKATPALRAVSSAVAEVPVEQAIRATREALAFAGLMTRWSMRTWVVCGVGFAVGMYYTQHTSLGVTMRVFSLGLFGILGTAAVWVRAEAEVEKIIEIAAECVGYQRVIDGVGERKASTRARILGFTGLVIVISVFLVGFGGWQLAVITIERLTAHPDGQAPEALAKQLRTVLFSHVGIFVTLLSAYAGWAALLASRLITHPLRRIATEAAALAEGRLREPRLIGGDGETWSLVVAFVKMQEQLKGALGGLRTASEQLSETSEQVATASSAFESGASTQAASLTQTSATTEELAQSARQIAGNAQAVGMSAEKTLDATEAGQASAALFSAAIERMKRDNQSIADAVAKLSQRVQQIGRIVEFINAIAGRADLLALAAELEGSKAGDAGRGFAAVAREMRRLAENVIESTREIEELITEIRDATVAVVEATGSAIRQTEDATNESIDVVQAFSRVGELAHKANEAVAGISTATSHQQVGTDQLASVMADVLRITEQNLVATRQVTAANQELKDLSRRAAMVVERFEVET